MREAADSSDHRVDAAARGPLQKFLELLSDSKARRSVRYGRPDEEERCRDAIHLGEQGARPGGALRGNDAHRCFDGEGDSEFGGEGREPVVPIREHKDLPVVARLEEFLGAAMQEADPGIGRSDDVIFEFQSQLKCAVLRGVEVTEIEDEICVEVTGCPERNEDFA